MIQALLSFASPCTYQLRLVNQTLRLASCNLWMKCSSASSHSLPEPGHLWREGEREGEGEGERRGERKGRGEGETEREGEGEGEGEEDSRR